MTTKYLLTTGTQLTISGVLRTLADTASPSNALATQIVAGFH